MTDRRSDPLRLFVCAVEPSGDALGAALIKALHVEDPHIEITGCGGPLMEAEGLKSIFPIERFSVIGPVSALAALPEALRAAGEISDHIIREKINAAVFIDSWDFSHIAARRLRRKAPLVKLIKYVAPQVWGSRPHRAKRLAQFFDGVLTLFDFEPEWFEKEGVKAQFVGSSTFQDAAAKRGEGDAFRRRHDIGAAPLLAILPGSRSGEITRLMEPFRQAVELIRAAKPETRIVLAMAPGRESLLLEASKSWPDDLILALPSERQDVFAAADAALAASGTVTTELAINDTPMVIAYRVSPLTAFWVRRVVTTDYVSLINIAAGEAVIPEYLQEACEPDALASAILPLLTDTQERRAQLSRFPALLERLGVGGPPAAYLAAKTVLEWVR